jgi:AcrR family transcriptional regulator
MSTKGRALSEGTAPNRLRGSADVQLPARNGLGAEQMVEIQRARMIVAMVEECAQHGPGKVTVAGVVERAGVSRRTFYEVFDDCEDCLLGALQEGLRRASEHVMPAYREAGRWSEKIRAALIALLEFLDTEPVMGRLLIVGSLGAGSRALERRRQVLARIIAVVGEGRALTRTGAAQSKAAKQPPPLSAEGIVGGVLSILHARLSSADDPGGLLELTGPLMSMIVLPYLGSAAAHRELQRPAPERQQSRVSSASDPLRELGLRLTYRTVRALVSVAEHPGASNREIGQAAGITDQGQMSKLLWRLERTGLIHNTGLGPGTGAPNIWTLTERGEAIHGVIVLQGTTAQ